MTSTLTRYQASGGAWAKLGQASLSRDATVTYGATLPVNGTTCGLTNAGLLTDYNSSATATVTLPTSLDATAIGNGWTPYLGGMLLRDKTIYGDIRPPTSTALDIYLINCKLKGGNTVPTTQDAVVKADTNRTATDGTNTKYLYVIDCEVDPQLPALNRDGIRGNRIRVYRTYVHDVIDGISPYANTTHNGGVIDSQVYGCLIENLRYGYPDYVNGSSGTTSHSDGTHTDGMQLHGGTNLHVKGNYINLTSTNLTGAGTNPTHPTLQAAGLANGQCILVTKVSTTPAADSTVIIEENWLKGGLAGIAINPGPSGVIIRNNRQSVTVYTANSNFQGRYFWVNVGAESQTGLPLQSDAVGDASHNNGNVWWDGPNAGNLLTRTRANGVGFQTVAAQPY